MSKFAETAAANLSLQRLMSPRRGGFPDDAEPFFAIKRDSSCGNECPHARFSFPFPHRESHAAGRLLD
jgi:hypothetical protein